MIAEFLMGVPQMVIGFRQLKELNKKERPTYSPGAEITRSYDRAKAMSTQGYTAGERAALTQRQAGLSLAQFRAGRAYTGGNMSAVLSTIMGLSSNEFNLGLAQSDAVIRRQNIQVENQLARDMDWYNKQKQQLEIMRSQQAIDAAAGLLNMGLTNIGKGLKEPEEFAKYVAGQYVGANIDNMFGGRGGNSPKDVSPSYYPGYYQPPPNYYGNPGYTGGFNPNAAPGAVKVI